MGRKIARFTSKPARMAPILTPKMSNGATGNSMKSLISVIYASWATEDFHEHEIPELLKHARVANAARELTGMLLYIGGAFVQVLEGEAASVDSIFETIRLDNRHAQVALIMRESILERAFEGWTMSHKTLDPVEAGELIGESSYFLSPTWVQKLDSAHAKILLNAASIRWKIERRTGKYRTLGRSA
ncbi:MAG: BLUF domain-containing protein [Gammaproteobacteria bacterium]